MLSYLLKTSEVEPTEYDLKMYNKINKYTGWYKPEKDKDISKVLRSLVDLKMSNPRTSENSIWNTWHLT